MKKNKNIVTANIPKGTKRLVLDYNECYPAELRELNEDDICIGTSEGLTPENSHAKK